MLAKGSKVAGTSRKISLQKHGTGKLQAINVQAATLSKKCKSPTMSADAKNNNVNKNMLPFHTAG